MKVTRSNFGDRDMQAERSSDPLLKWFQDSQSPTRALSKADKIIEKVGIGIVECVKSHYDAYLENPTPKKAQDYCLWRLRLHQRLKNNRDRLEEVNNARGLGLYDENPGPLCFDYDFD
jgi:hypothetical protein